jgi:hypothetical protein
MVRKEVSFLIAGLFSTTLGFSQILNVEKFRLDADTSKVWLGNIGAGVAIKKQQNTVYTFNGNINAVYLSDKHSYMSLNYIKLLRQESSNLVSEGYLHGRITFYRKQKLSYEPFLQYQYDVGRGLLSRKLAGYSFRYNFHSGEKFILAFNTGAMYEHEIWQGEVIRFRMDGKENMAETNFVKSTSNLTIRATLMENVSFFFVGYYQARYERFFKPRVITDIQLQFKVNKYLSFNTSFQSTLDALPAITNNNFVYTMNTTLLFNLNP